MLKTYYSLTKPGIIYGNAITTAAGFFLASRGHINITLLLATLAGISLIIASACVFNNYIDQDIDVLMARTSKRALVKGVISGRNALVYATILLLIGTPLLAAYTNLITLIIALTGFFVYVVMYGITKRSWVHGTIVGSISGAVPPVVGYCAVTGRLDVAALLLFLMLVFWQMPHFYAIAIYRQTDYATAKIPVLPIKKGISATKRTILAYIIAFTLTAGLLTVFGYTGWTYLIIVILLGAAWAWQGFKKTGTTSDILWARRMFRFSLIVIIILSATLSLAALLP